MVLLEKGEDARDAIYRKSLDRQCVLQNPWYRFIVSFVASEKKGNENMERVF
jgi:hypothetical protein